MAVRGSQSNAMLYSLITFVGLFVIATVCAIVFYVKSEEYRTLFENKVADTDKVATSREQAALSRIVGKSQEGKSSLGTMVALVDILYKAVTGQDASEEIPADMKVNEIVMQINNTVESLGADVSPTFGTDGIAILNTIRQLKQKLDAERARMQQFQTAYSSLQDEFDQDKGVMRERQDLFVSELKTSQTLTDEIRNKFDQLQQQMETATQEQIQLYEERVKAEQANLRQRQQELDAADQKLKETDTLLKGALTKLEAIKPQPDVKVAAFKPDARIVRVDLQNDLVTLDIGVKDRVYRGLTFAIYQSNAPIPEDAQGKAEIEVFQVGEQVSVARILRSEKRNPIVANDLVVNLIWDVKESNRFVVIGDFDTTGNGRANADGAARIRELVERWGGRIEDDITIETDFIVVGLEPAVPLVPTQNELDADPTAQQRYDVARQRLDAYNQQLAKAVKLRVPVFNLKQFMYLIGYETLAGKLAAN